MEKPYIKLNSCPLPDGLTGRIVMHIRRREQKREKTRASVFAGISFAALIGVVPAFENVAAAAARSGFAKYLSLIFSDGAAIAGIWKVFALSLAETAPFFAVSVSAAILLVCIWSAAEALRYSRAARMSLG